MPWILLPVVPLFTCYLSITSGLSVYPAWLLIPLAAWLGRCYGMRGAVTAIAGAIAVSFPNFELGPFQFGGDVGLAIVASWIAMACTAARPIDALAASARPFRSFLLFVAVVALLPLAIGVNLHYFDGGGTLRLVIGLQPLFLFTIFLSGLAGFAPRRAVTILIFAAALGATVYIFRLDAAVLESLKETADSDADDSGIAWLFYGLADLGTLITGFAFYFAGRLVKGWHSSGQTPSGSRLHPYALVATLTVLAALGTITEPFVSPSSQAGQVMGLHGNYEALIIASLLAGLLLGHVGTAFCAGLFVLLLCASNALALFLGRGVISLAIEQPIICVAYGALGVATRALLVGAPIPFEGKRWLQYGVLVAGVIMLATSSAARLELAAAVAAAIGGALVAALITWIRWKLRLRGVTLMGDGWIKLAWVIVIVTWAILHAGQIVSALLGAAHQLEIDGAAAIIVIVVLMHIPLALVMAVLARSIPKVVGDINAMRADV